MKKITLLVFSIILGIFTLSQIAFAENSVLFISPKTSTNTMGKTFNVSVQVDPTSNLVCVVKGTLVFDNLSCQSINIASGLLAQTSPSCAAPSFTIGIPSCTDNLKNILSISVKGSKVGQGALSLVNTKVINAGVDIPFELGSGSYNIIDTVKEEVPVRAPAPSVETSKKLVIPSKTTEVRLFDIIFKIENPLLEKSSNLVANTHFVSFGDVPTLVSLIYSIKDSNNIEVFVEKEEITVETEQIVSKDFKNLNLENGEYVLTLTTIYGDNIKDDFKQSFKVDSLTVPEAQARSSSWIVWLLIALIICGFIVYKIFNQKKQGIKNY